MTASTEFGRTSLVFVDKLFHAIPSDKQAQRAGRRHNQMWSHLWCNPGDEETLHALAAKVGMRRAWFQAKPGFPHYDLVPTRREKAVEAGAVETDLKEWLKSRRTTS